MGILFCRALRAVLIGFVCLLLANHADAVDYFVATTGDVDGADLLMLQRDNPAFIPTWQAQYGSGLPGAVASVSVPESGSFVLLSLSGLLFLGRRRNA